jgi:tetratricopeptide (TPR) repeat protein
MAEQDNSEIAELTEKIRLNPDDADAYYERARAYVRNGGYDKARNDFVKAAQLRSDGGLVRDLYYPVFANNKGEFYDIDSAFDDYTEAIRRNPNDAEAYFYRGCLYKNKGCYDQAIADYTEAIRLNPSPVNDMQRMNRINVYWFRGEIFCNKKDYDKAIVDYTDVIQVMESDAYFEPDNVGWKSIYSLRGKAYDAKGDHDSAMADYKEASETSRRHL